MAFHRPDEAALQLPEPKLEIEENPREGKMIALWRIADLP